MDIFDISLDERILEWRSRERQCTLNVEEFDIFRGGARRKGLDKGGQLGMSVEIRVLERSEELGGAQVAER